MAYRSNDDALRAQIDALTAEIAQLRAKERAVPRPASERAAGALALIGLACGGVAAWLGYAVSGYEVEIAAIGLGTVAMMLVMLAFIVSRLAIPSPGEILVVSGRRYTDASGTERGYRVERGRAIGIPFLERLDRFDASPFSVRAELDAYSRDGDVSIAYAAHLAFADGDAIIGAIERFLGRPRDDVRKLAEETLEAAVREVLSTTTGPQLREDRGIVAEAVIEVARPNLEPLGLIVRSWVILDVEQAILEP